MNFSSIARVLGTLSMVTGCSMLLPALYALYYNEGDLFSLVISALLTIGAGLPFWWIFRRNNNVSIRDGFFIAFFGWILISAFSALPFVIHGSIPSFTSAFFEMMSGYTTTGATILTDVESVPHGLLFWRSETHLLGGMGFLTLTVLFMPQGMGGLRIFRAEASPGQAITGEKFKARNKDAVIWLWAIYLGLNALETLLLWVGGMPIFDALCHAFGTVSTSGYSTKNAGIGYYDSAFFDWVITLFMFFGGATFILYYHAIKRDWLAIKINTELRWYLGFLLFFCGFTSFILWQTETYASIADSVRYATFQVMSLLTTTGFTTADYEIWPQAAQMFLYAVCFVGACAGSTGSGIKIVHFAIVWKYFRASIRRIFIQPLSVFAIRINQVSIDYAIIDLAICYFIVNIFMVFAGGCVMVMIADVDYVTGMSSVIATLMNIGPGFGSVGPTENYAHISDIGQWFLSWNMLVGRLDMFSALIIFYPSFWKQ